MSKPSLESLVEHLLRALNQPEAREQSLQTFERLVEDSKLEGIEPWIQEILVDLATDLAYYEPDPQIRWEDAALFGDDHVETVIRTALRRLEDRGIPTGDYGA